MYLLILHSPNPDEEGEPSAFGTSNNIELTQTTLVVVDLYILYKNMPLTLELNIASCPMD